MLVSPFCCRLSSLSVASRALTLTNLQVVFIDESQTASNDVSSPDSGPDEYETTWDSPTLTSDVSSHRTPSSSAGIPPFRPSSPPDRLRLMMISSVVDPPTTPNWPLTNPEEAYLFRHFVQNLAMWVREPDTPYRLMNFANTRVLSLTCAIRIVRLLFGALYELTYLPRIWTDIDRDFISDTFEIIVPQRARDCPVLLKSIFALSARHLGQTRSGDGVKSNFNQLADRYNEACINIMRDLLMSSHYQSGWTEHLFAATIILQVMEEMNGMTVCCARLGLVGLTSDPSRTTGRKRRHGC